MSSVGEIAELLWPATLETLAMVGVAGVLSCVVGATLGVTLVLLAPDGLHPRPRTHKVLAAFVDLGRSVPFTILQIAIIPLTRTIVGTSIGTAAATVPLVVAAIPYVARLVEAALREVPAGLVEAVGAMGATTWQIVAHAYLREAAPALVRAATVATVSLVSFSAMAGAVGGGGLGDLAVRYGYQRFRTDVMLATVVVLVVLVQSVQRLGDSLARRLDHR